VLGEIGLIFYSYLLSFFCIIINKLSKKINRKENFLKLKSRSEYYYQIKNLIILNNIVFSCKKKINIIIKNIINLNQMVNENIFPYFFIEKS